MGEGLKRAVAAAKATRVAVDVRVGQVWRDNYPGVARLPLRVVKIESPYCWLQEFFPNGRDAGKPSRVQLARMRPTSRGYRLEQDVPAAATTHPATGETGR